MGVFQKVVDTVRRTVKKPPQPQSDINTISYYQYFLPCQDEDTIQVEDLPRKRSPCVNLKTLEGWKGFQVKGDVLLTGDDFTSPEPSRVRHVTSETNQRLYIPDTAISEPGEHSSTNHVHPTTKSFLWGFLQRHWQLRCIITGISLLQILNACHVVERKYSKQDLVAIYQAIGGYVFIHSKINILPMTFGMHIARDRGLILIYIRERKVLNAIARYFSFLCYRRPIQFDWLSIVRKCDEHLYDGREVKVGFSPKFDLVQKGITGFNYCGQTRAHPILLLVRLAFLTSQPDFDCDSFICPPEDKEPFRQTLELAMDIGDFLQEYKSRGDEGEVINSARGDKGDNRGKKGGKGDKGGQDGGPTKPGDLPHEGMVIHCAVMEEVSSTFANDGWAHFDGVVVDHPRPISTASMTEAQSIVAVWRNPHNVLPNHPHPLRYYLPLWNKLGNGFAKTFLHWSVTSL